MTVEPVPKPTLQARPAWAARPAAVAAIAMVAVFAAVLVAAGRWAMREPLPVTPDEAHYYKFVCHDHTAWATRGPKKWLAAFVWDDRSRPPAYRLLVAPLVALPHHMPDFALLRVAAMGWLCVAAALMAAAVRRFTGSWAAGVIAAVGGAMATKVVLSTIHFGTEYTTYVGAALTVFGLARDWDRPDADARSLRWWPLAIGFGLSALAKSSFGPLAVLPPLILVGAWWAGWVRGPRPSYLLAAGAVGAALAAPWWVLNWKVALGFAQFSVHFKRRTLGAAGYLESLLRHEIGWPISLLIAVPLIAFAVHALRRRPRGGPTLAAVLMLALPPLALVAYQTTSSNQDGRLVSNGFPLLAAAAVVGAVSMGWLRSRLAAVGAVVAVVVQGALAAGPPSVVQSITAHAPIVGVSLRPGLRHWSQCDWEPLRDLCLAHGLPTPRIALLGMSSTVNSDQLETAWAAHGQVTRVDPLWRWDLGDYPAADVERDAARADVAVTAPALVGDTIEQEWRDNAHNAEFSRRLAADPAWGAPTHLTVGAPDEEIALDVFFRRRPAATRP